MITIALWPLLLPAVLVTTPQPDSVPLYTDLGAHHMPISTHVPAAQRYFDQGMRLVYAFNHAEAVRAFEEAARLDPDCAICHWGSALAYGPNINAPMDPAGGAEAWSHLQAAIALRDKASPRERALIDALAKRYASPPPADRAALDSAYASSMAELIASHPDDLDLATLYAEALMNLRPWAYWTKEGEPYPGTTTILAQLERVMAANPDHPGACHYYIHAVEAVAPEKAVQCAERLASLMPGAGHIVHMPAHIYIRVGRYADAIQSNIHATHADETYIAGEKPSGMYPMGYYPHNYHFLAMAAMMAGRGAQAIDAARKLAERVPVDVARAVPPLESLIPYTHQMLATFGMWDDVLREPVPPSDLRLSFGLAQYARGVAFAAKKDWTAAAAALDTVTAIARGTSPADRTAMSSGTGENKIIMDIAMHALTAEIAYQRGDFAGAVAHFTAAAELEDSFNYVEPPQWAVPIRRSLGAALLKVGRPADAERVYMEDLKRFPENGWSLFGLAASLRAQGKTGEANVAGARLARTWLGADVVLAGSRF
jgi:tetratricopeptide (TPR) repeat protein